MTYEELEQSFAVKFCNKVPLFRYCQNNADKKRIGRRMRNPRYANVLGDNIPIGKGTEMLEDTHGSFHIKHTAYVDLPLLLETLRDHFLEQNIFQNT